MHGLRRRVGQTPVVIIIPEAFAAATRAREGAEGEAWLEALPALVERLLIRWHLHVVGPPLHGYVALVVPVLRPDSTMAMLKVSWVDEETRVEALALAAWGGVGAVTLLDSAPQEGALLLERLEPHTSLQQLPEDQAVAAAAALLPQLQVPPPDGLRNVADLARRRHVTLGPDWETLGCPAGETSFSKPPPPWQDWWRNPAQSDSCTGTTTTPTCWRGRGSRQRPPRRAGRTTGRPSTPSRL